jgi:hypothetical protein
MRDTIDMANEAGGILLSDSEIWGLGYEFELYQLKAFEALVRADEREACAKFAEESLTRGRSPLGPYVADAIRARGNT